MHSIIRSSWSGNLVIFNQLYSAHLIFFLLLKWFIGGLRLQAKLFLLELRKHLSLIEAYKHRLSIAHGLVI